MNMKKRNDEKGQMTKDASVSFGGRFSAFCRAARKLVSNECSASMIPDTGYRIPI